MSFSKIDSKTFDDGKNKEVLTDISLGQFASSVDNTPSNEVDFKVLDKEKKEALTKEALKDFDSTKLNISFDKSELKDFDYGNNRIWLLKNKKGGYSAGRINGCNGSKYDGLLISSFKSPGERYLVISKINEVVSIDGKEYNLSTNQAGGCIEDGYKYLQSVEVGVAVTFSYNVGGVIIEKKVCMDNDKNAVSVLYSVKSGDKPVTLKLYPLVNYKDFHSNSCRPYMNFKTDAKESGFTVNPVGTNVNIDMQASEGKFTKCDDMWYYNMQYQQDIEKGLSPSDDHYMPGYFTIDVEPNVNKDITILGSTEKIEMTDGKEIIKREVKRCNDLLKKANYKDIPSQRKVLAADKYIVDRESTGSKTILAGYPWFLDWGRDTMISLTGSTLLTKRYDDAKGIFDSFAKYMYKGLIPNMFPNLGEKPIYNTVDGSLWFFEAISNYLKHTNDHEYVKEKIYPKLKEIIYWYKKGTDFDIKMNDDALISCGPQVTWMDAKIGDWVVTPRDGKPVEINALWYNALMTMDNLAQKYGEDPTMYRELAVKVKESFKKFWNNEEQCLYDVIKDDYKDASIRPNQIFALSLTHPVIGKKKGKKILAKVYDELYTPRGLRSLSPKDNKYRGKYNGDRDYHEGTVWDWLKGPYIGADLKVHNYSKKSRKRNLKLLKADETHMREAGVGLNSEIADGDFPHKPKGCYGQVWSDAEEFRALLGALGVVKY